MRCKGKRIALVLVAVAVAGCSSKVSPSGTEAPGPLRPARAAMALEGSPTGLETGQVGPQVGSTGGKATSGATTATGGGPATRTNALGLTGLIAKPPHRVPLRRPNGGVTLSAWRLEITCDQGRGGIVRDDTSSQESYFSGDGILVGWSQARLAEIYETLTKSLGAEDPNIEFLQCG